MRRIILAILPYNLDDAHLQRRVHHTDVIIHSQDPFSCLGQRTIGKEHEGVTFARCVGFGCKERLHELWRVRDEVLELAVDGVDGKYSVLADVGMAVFETRATCRNEWF